MGRLIASVVVLLFAGCNADRDTAKERADATHQVADARLCPADCGACPQGTTCVTSGSFAVKIVAACLRPCTATSDCRAGDKCMIMDSRMDARTPSFCVSASLPACEEIGYGHSDFFGVAPCLDANTLLVHVPRFGVFSGWERVHCPHGCGTRADAGPAPRCL